MPPVERNVNRENFMFNVRNSVVSIFTLINILIAFLSKSKAKTVATMCIHVIGSIRINHNEKITLHVHAYVHTYIHTAALYNKPW